MTERDDLALLNQQYPVYIHRNRPSKRDGRKVPSNGTSDSIAEDLREKAWWEGYPSGIAEVDCSICARPVLVVSRGGGEGVCIETRWHPTRVHDCSRAGTGVARWAGATDRKFLAERLSELAHVPYLTACLTGDSNRDISQISWDWVEEQTATLVQDGHLREALAVLLSLRWPQRTPMAPHQTDISITQLTIVLNQALQALTSHHGRELHDSFSNLAKLVKWIHSFPPMRENARLVVGLGAFKSTLDICYIKRDSAAVKFWRSLPVAWVRNELEDLEAQAESWDDWESVLNLRLKIALDGDRKSFLTGLADSYRWSSPEFVELFANYACVRLGPSELFNMAKISDGNRDGKTMFRLRIAAADRGSEDALLWAAEFFLTKGDSNRARKCAKRLGQLNMGKVPILAKSAYLRGDCRAGRLWAEILEAEDKAQLEIALLGYDCGEASILRSIMLSTYCDFRLSTSMTLLRAAYIRDDQDAVHWFLPRATSRQVRRSSEASAILVKVCYEQRDLAGARYVIRRLMDNQTRSMGEPRRKGQPRRKGSARVARLYQDLVNAAYRFNDFAGAHLVFTRIRFDSVRSKLVLSLLRRAIQIGDSKGSRILEDRIRKSNVEPLKEQLRNFEKPATQASKALHHVRWRSWKEPVENLPNSTSKAVHAKRGVGRSGRNSKSADARNIPYGIPDSVDDSRSTHRSALEWGTTAYGCFPEEALSETTDDDHDWRGGDRYY